ncbi:MAG TPA: hypothetical protein PLK60_10380 [Myxococcota bacterium]|nr:hypothetical protein [Myxococcota bacterium]
MIDETEGIRLEPRERDALGLPAGAPLRWHPVRATADVIHHGKMVMQQPVDAWMVVTPLRCGLTEEYRPADGLVRLSFDETMRAFEVRGTIGGVRFDVNRSGLLKASLAPESAFSIRLDEETVLAILRDARGDFHRCLATEAGDRQDRFEQVLEVLRARLDEKSPEWLRSAVLRHLDGMDALSQVMALAVFRRFRCLCTTADEVRIAIERAMAQDATVLSDFIDDWIQSQSMEEVRRIESLALEEVRRLRDLLHEVEETLDPEEPAWIRRWIAWCESRDDLEALRVLVDLRGGSPRLDAELRSLDEQGDNFRVGLPRRITTEVTRLREVASLDPGAWWARDSHVGDVWEF